MPANNRQEWTDDDAFWEEAWADMEQRLDGDPPRRRAFAWWTWAYEKVGQGPRLRSLVLGSVLLLGVITAWQYAPRKKVNAPPAKVRTEMAQPEVSPPFVAKAPDPPREEMFANDGPGTPDLTPVSQGRTTEETAPPPRKTEEAFMPTATAPVQNPVPSTKAVATFPSITPEEVIIPVRAPVPAAAILLAEQAITPLPPADLIAPTLRKIRPRQSAQLRLDAGGNAHPNLTKPGYYAGLSFVPSRGKWRFPLGVHLRREDLRITTIGGNEGLDQGVQVPINGQGNQFADARRALLTDLQSTGFDEIRTLGLELRAGAEFTAGKRLSLTGGLGLEYLLHARGPIITGDSVSYRALRGTDNFVNLDLGFSNDYVLAAGESLTEERGAGEGSGGSVYRLVPRAYLGLRYRLNARFSLEAAGNFLLRPIYREDAASLATSRLRVGVSWRIR